MPVITGPASPTKTDPLAVTIAFGQAVTGFALGDLTVTGGAATALTDNGGGSFTATIDAAADGAVTVNVAAGVAADLAGNVSAASNPFSVTVDNDGAAAGDHWAGQSYEDGPAGRDDRVRAAGHGIPRSAT